MVIEKLKSFINKFTKQEMTQTVEPQHNRFVSKESLWNNFEARTQMYMYGPDRMPNDDLTLYHWIGSIAYDGYQREKSLKYLIANYAEDDENRILLRLADWVPQIQLIAQRWVLENFSSLSLNTICKNEKLLLYLIRKELLKGNPAVEEIKNVLCRHAEHISKEQFLKFYTVFRRFFYEISDNARRFILSDPDPYNRKKILDYKEINELTDAELSQLKSDKSLMVQKNFFYRRIASEIIPTEDEMMNMCFSDSKSIRGIGQFYLKKFYQIDAYSIYQSQCNDYRFFAADYEKSCDIELFIEGVDLENRKLSYLCLKTICKTSPEIVKSLNLQKLLKKSRKFYSILSKVIPQEFSYYEIKELKLCLVEIFNDGIFRYLNLLCAKNYWFCIKEALEELKLCEDVHIYEYIRDMLCTVASNDILPKELNKNQIKNLINECSDEFHVLKERLLFEIEHSRCPL